MPATDALHRTTEYGPVVSDRPRPMWRSVRLWRAWRLRTVPLCDVVLEKIDRWRYAVLGLLVLTFLAGFNGIWRAEPDSALYLSIAKNLATGRGYTYNGVTNDLAYPGLPLLMAGVFKVFGTASLVPANAVMLALGLVALALNYRLFKLYGGRPLAVVMTCGLGFTRTFYRYSFQIMTDLPFLVGVLAFFAGYESLRAARRDAVAQSATPHRAGAVDWILMVVGLAVVIVTRPAMYAFIPVVAAGIIAGAWRTFSGRGKSGPRWVWLAVGTGVVLILYAMLKLDPRAASHSGTMGQYEEFVFQQYTVHLDQTVTRIVHDNIPHLLNEIVADAVFGIEFGPWLTPAFSVILLMVGLAVARRNPVWGLWVGLTLAMMIFILPVDRYLLPILPFIIYGWWTTITWINRRLRRPWGDIAFAFLVVLGMGANVVKVGVIIFDQHRPDFFSHYKEGRLAPLAKLAGAIHLQTAPGDLILSPAKTARVLSFWSDRRVTEFDDYASFDVAAQPVWVVVDPIDKEKMTETWIPSLNVKMGRVMATIDRPGLPPLELHRTRRH